jgi:ubiquinone/menaquinone biosynthesis C-methylase UbiE
MGQTLIALRLAPHVEAWGIDYDSVAIAAGQELSSSNIHLVVGSGERLPFPDASFDLVFSRVALPYMHLPTAISEIARVLRTGGDFWATLHPPKMLLQRIWQDIARGNPKGLCACGFIGLNSILLHFSGRQLQIMKYCETVQTKSRMQRLLNAVDLQTIPIEPSRHMIVQAFKSGN